MPRSCPCRTCKGLEEAKQERGLEEVFICFGFLSVIHSCSFLLGDAVHNLPIVRRMFLREFQEHIEFNMMAFPSFLRFCSNFCFPMATSFPAFFIGYKFFRHFHQFPASAICWSFFPLLQFWFSPNFPLFNGECNILNVNKRTKQTHILSLRFHFFLTEVFHV